MDYARFQGLDAAQMAVTTLGTALGESLPEAHAAAALLQKIPTLLILDNLEALAPEPLRELLEAAVPWSQAGGSRVLLTTRRPEFGHAQYRVQGTLIHQRIQLVGLGSRQAPDDALEWFAELSKLPPAPTLRPPRREELIDLFDRVRFHPLSIRVLAQHLKTRRAAELGERLEHLLAEGARAGQIAADEDTPAGLLASLELSLDRLDEASRRLLSRLGVFQGGAMEHLLLQVTEIPELKWKALRAQLEAAALVEAVQLPGVKPPFLSFHPTLAPMLWNKVSKDEQARLIAANRQRYYALANYLYEADNRTPHQARAIARRELPNLLHAAYGALEKGGEEVVDFANSLNHFVGRVFHLKKETEALVARAQDAAGENYSPARALARSNWGEQLLASGRVGEAIEVFQEVLAALGETPSYFRAATLGRLGRSFRHQGRPALAIARLREALEMLDHLGPSDPAQRERGACLLDLADALVDQGEYRQARQTYEDGLSISGRLADYRSQAVAFGQLGTLALKEGELAEAEERHRAALVFFQRLAEPASEAEAWHQLGRVLQEGRQWEESERHYRESARIREIHGDLSGAAKTWNQLAMVSKGAGRPEAAEGWYRKTRKNHRGSP